MSYYAANAPTSEASGLTLRSDARATSLPQKLRYTDHPGNLVHIPAPLAAACFRYPPAPRRRVKCRRILQREMARRARNRPKYSALATRCTVAWRHAVARPRSRVSKRTSIAGHDNTCHDTCGYREHGTPLQHTPGNNNRFTQQLVAKVQTAPKVQNGSSQVGATRACPPAQSGIHNTGNKR